MIVEGKRCVYAVADIKSLEQDHEKEHKVSQGIMSRRQDMVKKRSSSICELNSDQPRRHHAFFEEPLSSSLLLLDTPSLKEKYFDEKAKLRQKLMKGLLLDEESDDREEEEEIRDGRPHAGTKVNLAADSTRLDECFDQEARDRETDWKEDTSLSSPVVFNKGRLHHHTSTLSTVSSHESDNEQRHMQRINQKGKFNKLDSIEHCASPFSSTSTDENERREYPIMQRSRQKRRFENNYSRPHESDNDQRHVQRINQKGKFNKFDSIEHRASPFSSTSSDENERREYPMQRSRQKRRFENNYSRPHESDNDQRHVQRINQRGKFNKFDSTEHRFSPFSSTSTDENERREYLPTRYRQQRRFENNYSRKYSSFEETWIWQPYKPPDSRRSTSHSIGCSSNEYEKELKTSTRITCTRKQPSYSYDSTTPVTPPQYHDGQLRNGSRSTCEKPKPNQYHMNGSDETKQNHHAQIRAHTKQGQALCFNFDERIEALKNYKIAHGNLNVPTDTSSPTGSLGNWLTKAREDLVLHEMGLEPKFLTPCHEWKFEILKQLVDFDTTASARAPRITFDELVTLLRKYKGIHGNLNIEASIQSSPSMTTTLGIWLMQARADLEMIQMGCEPQYFFPSDEGQWDILKKLGVADAQIAMYQKKESLKRLKERQHEMKWQQRGLKTKAQSYWYHGPNFNDR